MDLGKKVTKPVPAPAPKPKYRAHPTNPHIRINQQTGAWETIQPIPVAPVWPFPLKGKP